MTNCASRMAELCRQRNDTVMASYAFGGMSLDFFAEVQAQKVKHNRQVGSLRDSKDFEEAAEDLGAGKFKTLFYVTLPLLKPGIVSGALLAFTLSLDDVIISFFTAGPGTNTLPLYIYSVIKTGITPDVNALTTLMLLITAGILTFSAFYQTRKLKKI